MMGLFVIEWDHDIIYNHQTIPQFNLSSKLTPSMFHSKRNGDSSPSAAVDERRCPGDLGWDASPEHTN